MYVQGYEEASEKASELIHCLNYMRHMVGLFGYKHWFGLATGDNWYFFLKTGLILSFV